MFIEDYVSFKIAKLLKEKSFDECPLFRYDDCGQLWVQGGYNKTIKWHFPAPTLQSAIKWIREKGFHIYSPMEIDYDEDERGDKWYHDAAYYPEIIRVSDGKIMYDDGSLYATPEQACEAAIKYCLENLI